MADIAALKQAVDAAYAAEEELLAERRANRDAMSRRDFRAYNEDTYQRQIDTQRAIDDAEKALQAALNNARQELMVGTLSESESQGGASG